MALTEQIDNYPGFESGIDGFTLGEKMQQSAERFGAVTELAEVYKVSLSGRIKTLDTSEGVFRAARWSSPPARRPVPWAFPARKRSRERAFTTAPPATARPIAAGPWRWWAAATPPRRMHLPCPASQKKVYLIHRRDSLRATKVYHEPLMSAPNVEFCWNSTVSALLHESRLTGLRLKDVNTGAERELACDGVFISVGRAPATELFWDELALDKSGYIIADESTRTSISPACSPWATCAPRRCGRWSPPYRTARWPSTTQRNIWRRTGKEAANDPLIGSSCPQATRLRALPHRGAG